MSPLVPRPVAADVGRLVNEEADRIGWDRLPQADKTAKLGAWVDEEAIGGVLLPLLGGEAEVRLWLKDVALRRRSWGRQLSADVVAGTIFGEGADFAVLDVGLKPSHATIRIGAELHYLAWGPHANARNLFWAALNASLDNVNPRTAHVVIVDTSTSTTPADRRARFETIAARCGLKLDWITG